MARVSQFAKDLGISYNQAKDLINKGRKRRDGGSQILENTMTVTKKKFGGATLTSKGAKKINDHKIVEVDTFSFTLFFKYFKVKIPPIK